MELPLLDANRNQASELEKEQSNEPSIQSGGARPIYNNPQSMAEETLGGRTADIVKYQSLMEGREEAKRKLQGEIEKTDKKIDELKNAHRSVRDIVKKAFLFAIAVGGLITAVTGGFGAPVACCIVVGVIVTALAFAITGYILHKGNCDRQAQIEMLKKLQNVEKERGELNEEITNAYGNLAAMTGNIVGQQMVMEEQKETIVKQQRQVEEQGKNIETLGQRNTELEGNLTTAQKAREDAERQVQEIKTQAAELQSTLTIIGTKITENEVEIERLKQTNVEQAEKLRKQTEAMKAFVDQQKEMVSSLENTINENKEYFEDMWKKVQTNGSEVNQQMEEIKEYVNTNFEAVRERLTTVTTENRALLDDLQNKETTITIEKLVDVQKNVNKAILDSVTQLGLMQEHIVCGLTKAQEKIENQQDEMKAAVEILQQNHEDAMKNVSLLKTSYAKAEENLRKCTEQANNALNEATRLSQQAKKTDTDKLVQEAMENAQQFNRKAEQLRRHLGTMKTSLNEAQEKTTDIAKVLGEMTDKQKQIEGNCETLKQQSEMLRASNDVLFGQAEKIGGNLRVVGESVDRIATFTSDAVASVGNVTSRWSNFAAMIGAAAGSIGAAAVGSGVLATGALAVAGVMVAAYTVEANRGHIQEVKDKVIRLKDSIRLIAETSLRNISNITSRITSLGTTIVDFLNRINPLTT